MGSTTKPLEASNPAISAVQDGQPASVAPALVRGAASLGLVTAAERAFTFAANLWAARIAGPQIFGTYSTIITTILTMHGYVGTGMGAAAVRFGGQDGLETPEYRRVHSILVRFSLFAAAVAAIAVASGGSIIARTFLHQPALANLFRIGAAFAAALALLECCRGFLIGQRNYGRLLVLTLVSGLGLLITLPVAAHSGARAMLWAQSGVAAVALAIAVFLVRPRRANRKTAGTPANVDSSRILRFALLHLGTVVALNTTSWFVLALIVRSDGQLLQAGYYGVANQLRNGVAILPGLIAQAGYALLASNAARQSRPANEIVKLGTSSTALLSLLGGGFALVALPWVLHGFYGYRYDNAEQCASFAIITAAVHSIGAPAASRLLVESLRYTTYVNAIWAIVVCGLALRAVPVAGAAGAAFAVLIGHLCSVVLVLIALSRLGLKCRRTVMASGKGLVCILGVGALAFCRTVSSSHSLSLTVAMLVVLSAGLYIVFRETHKTGWRLAA